MRPVRRLLLASLIVAVAIPSAGDTASAPDAILAGLIFRLDQLSGGDAIAQARELLCSPDVVDRVLDALDRNSDAALSFDEVLQVKPLELAAQLSKLSPVPDPGDPIGDDVLLTDELERANQDLADYLQLGVANETELPNLSLDSLRGDPRGFLEAAADFPKVQVRRLADLIADLDARAFPAGDMAGGTLPFNMRRKEILLGHAQRLARHVGRRNLAPLQQELMWLRERMDGAAPPPDWATGPKAAVIVARIDEVLALLGVPSDSLKD